MPSPLDRRRLAYSLLFIAAAIYSLRYLLRGTSDLEIYMMAAQEMVDGTANLYRAREGYGPYPYPHFVLLPFAAAQWLMSEMVVKALYGLALAGVTVLMVRDLDRVLRPYGVIRSWHWALFGLLFVRTFSGNLHHGQLSLFVSAFMLHGVVEIAQKRSVRGGLWLGLAAATKLTPALFLVALLITGRIKAFAVMLATVLVCIVVLPWPFLGGDHVRHLSDFNDAMIMPRFGVETETAFPVGISASIRGTIPYVFKEMPPNEDGYQFSWAHLDEGTIRWVMIPWSGLLLLICAWGFYRRRDEMEERWIEQSAVVMMAMALFSPLTRTYHLSGITLCGLLFCRAAWPARGRTLFVVTTLLFAFSTTLRQTGLVGHYGWWFLDNAGFPHLALVCLLCWLSFGPRLAAGERRVSDGVVAADS